MTGYQSIFGDTAAGVPNPEVPHLHPYPTRYHGPVFRYAQQRSVFRRRPYYVEGGLGADVPYQSTVYPVDPALPIGAGPDGLGALARPPVRRGAALRRPAIAGPTKRCMFQPATSVAQSCWNTYCRTRDAHYGQPLSMAQFNGWLQAGGCPDYQPPRSARAGIGAAPALPGLTRSALVDAFIGALAGYFGAPTDKQALMYAGAGTVAVGLGGSLGMIGLLGFQLYQHKRGG